MIKFIVPPALLILGALLVTPQIATAQPKPAAANSGAKPGATTPPVSMIGDDSTPTGVDPSVMFTGIMDPFDYEQRGRRDPFVEPVADKQADQGGVRGPLLPLQRFDLSQLRLVGIIWDVKHPRAMIKDPTGETHVVSTNTKVGPRNGYIAVIREGEMVVVETQEQEGKLVSSAQVVKIAR